MGNYSSLRTGLKIEIQIWYIDYDSHEKSSWKLSGHSRMAGHSGQNTIVSSLAAEHAEMWSWKIDSNLDRKRLEEMLRPKHLARFYHIRPHSHPPARLNSDFGHLMLWKFLVSPLQTACTKHHDL